MFSVMTSQRKSFIESDFGMCSLKRLMAQLGKFLTTGSEPAVQDLLLSDSEYHKQLCEVFQCIKKVYDLHWKVHSETLIELMAKQGQHACKQKNLQNDLGASNPSKPADVSDLAHIEAAI